MGQYGIGQRNPTNLSEDGCVRKALDVDDLVGLIVLAILVHKGYEDKTNYSPHCLILSFLIS